MQHSFLAPGNKPLDNFEIDSGTNFKTYPENLDAMEVLSEKNRSHHSDSNQELELIENHNLEQFTSVLSERSMQWQSQ
jgi:hypothetical protein